MNRELYFLPYMTRLSSRFEEKFCQAGLSHRSKDFMQLYHRVEENLCRLTRAEKMQILCGTGSLANDVIAWQLKSLNGKGIIFSNGEFGERLIDHASAAKLSFTPLREEWGDPFPYSVAKEIIKKENIRWVWFVHSETSTGGINRMEEITELARLKDIFICADCISSIGNIPVDLSRIDMASCSSNKGLGSYAGLSIVFYNRLPTRSPASPPLYLDIRNYIKNGSLPFTMPPQLLACLDMALIHDREHFSNIVRLNQLIREEIKAMGFSCFRISTGENPAVLTVMPPDGVSSTVIGDNLKRKGIHIAYESRYLRARNLFQIALMGEKTSAEAERLLEGLAEPEPFSGRRIFSF